VHANEKHRRNELHLGTPARTRLKCVWPALHNQLIDLRVMGYRIRDDLSVSPLTGQGGVHPLELEPSDHPP
jgi:hypothetical protein